MRAVHSVRVASPGPTVARRVGALKRFKKSVACPAGRGRKSKKLKRRFSEC
jgi:hypothetical protein